MRDRRVFQRSGAAIKLYYEALDKPAAPKKALSKDISGTGIRFALNEKLEDGANLKLRMFLADMNNEITVTVYGVVIWARRAESVCGAASNGYYEAGIRFTVVDPVVLGRIMSHFGNNK